MPQNPNRQVSLSEWEQRVKKHYGIGDDEWTQASQAGTEDGDPFEAIAARGKALATQKQLASLPTETPPFWDTPIVPIRPQSPIAQQPEPIQESTPSPIRPQRPRQIDGGPVVRRTDLSPWMTTIPSSKQSKQADRQRRGPVWPQYQGEGFLVNPSIETLSQVTGRKMPAKYKTPPPTQGLQRPGTPPPQAQATPQAQPQRPGFLQDIVETALPFAAGALAPIVSKTMTTPAEGSIRQAVNTAGQAYSKGLAQIPQGVAQFGEAVTRLRQLAPQQAPADGLGPVSRIFDKPTQTLVKGAEQRFPTNPDGQSWMTSKIPQVLGSVGAFATTGGVGQALGLPGMASSAIAGTGMQVASFMDEVKQAGIDPARINQGIAMAGLTGMTEMFGLGKVLDKFGVKKQVIERGLNILEEAGQEAFQGYLEDINAKLVAANDPSRNIDPNSVDFWLKRGEEAALGAIGGGLFGGADILTQRIATRADGGAAKVPDAAQQETTPPQAPPSVRQTTPMGTEPLVGPPGAPEQAQAPDKRTAGLAILSSKPEALKVAMEQAEQAQQQFERSMESGRVEDAVTALKRKEQALREARNKVKGDTPEGLRTKQRLWDEIQGNRRQIDAVQAEQKRQKVQPTPQAQAPAQPIAPAVDENAPTAGQPVPPMASVPTEQLQEQPQELAQAVGQTGTPSARMRGPSPNILSGRPRPGRVLQFPSQQPAGASGLLREPTNRIDSNQDYPGGEVQRTAGLQPEGQPVEAPTQAEQTGRPDFIRPPQRQISRITPNPMTLAARNIEGRAINTRVQAGLPTAKPKRKGLPVTEADVKGEYGYIPMAMHQAPREIYQKAKGAYNVPESASEKETFEQIVEPLAMEMSAVLGRSVSASLGDGGLRELTNKDWARWHEQIGKDHGFTQEDVDELRTAIFGKGADSVFKRDDIQQIVLGETGQASGKVQDVLRQEFADLLGLPFAEVSLSQISPRTWRQWAVRRGLRQDQWQPIATAIARGQRLMGAKQAEQAPEAERVTEEATTQDLRAQRQANKERAARSPFKKAPDLADQAAMAAEGRRTQRAETTTQTRTQGSVSGERTGGQVAAQVDQATPRVEEARREPEADSRFAGYKTIVGKRTGHADDPHIFTQGKPVNDILGNPTGWVKRTDFNPMKATTQGYVAMYNPITKERIDFASSLEAQNFAIDNANEYTPSVPGELEIKPVFKQPAASESPAQPAPAPAAARAERPSAPAPEQPAQVQFIITRDMRQQLADLGYSKADVNAMQPQEAADIIASGITKAKSQASPAEQLSPAVAPSPTRTQKAKEQAKAPPAKKRAKVADLLALGWTQVHSQEYRKGDEWRLVRNMEHRGSEPYELTRDGEVVQRFGSLGDAINSIVEQGQAEQPPQAQPAPPRSVTGIAPMVSDLLATGTASVADLRTRIANVQYGPIEDGVETFTFTIDGAPYKGRLTGRNQDLILGASPEQDAGIAARVVLDKQAQPVAQPEQAAPAQEQPAPAPTIETLRDSIPASMAQAAADTDAHRAALRTIANRLPDGTVIRGWKKTTIEGDVLWIKNNKKGVADIAMEVGGQALVKAAGLPEDAAYNPQDYLAPKPEAATPAAPATPPAPEQAKPKQPRQKKAAPPPAPQAQAAPASASLSVTPELRQTLDTGKFYHGTASPEAFDAPRPGSWLADSPRRASEYAPVGREGSARVYPVTVKAKNPYVVASIDDLGDIAANNEPWSQDALRQQGYDVAVWQDPEGELGTIIFTLTGGTTTSALKAPVTTPKPKAAPTEAKEQPASPATLPNLTLEESRDVMVIFDAMKEVDWEAPYGAPVSIPKLRDSAAAGRLTPSRFNKAVLNAAKSGWFAVHAVDNAASYTKEAAEHDLVFMPTPPDAIADWRDVALHGNPPGRYFIGIGLRAEAPNNALLRPWDEREQEAESRRQAKQTPKVVAKPQAKPTAAKAKPKTAAPPNLADIMPLPGRPMEMAKLKQKLRDAGMSEGEIDKFILDKKASYEIALMKAYGPDDVKARTTEAERAEMVQDQFGNWYNGATRRTEQETKEAQTPAQAAGETDAQAQIQISAYRQRRPDEVPIVRRALAKEEAKGRPAIAYDDIVVKPSGKYQIQTDGTLKKVQDLAPGGFRRVLMGWNVAADPEWVDANPAALKQIAEWQAEDAAQAAEAEAKAKAEAEQKAEQARKEAQDRAQVDAFYERIDAEMKQKMKAKREARKYKWGEPTVSTFGDFGYYKDPTYPQATWRVIHVRSGLLAGQFTDQQQARRLVYRLSQEVIGFGVDTVEQIPPDQLQQAGKIMRQVRDYQMPEQAQPAQVAVPEPWQMTREDVARLVQPDNVRPAGGFRAPALVEGAPATKNFRTYDAAVNWLHQEHKKIVQRAISEGKPVPSEVLADYPALQPKEAKAPAQATPRQEAQTFTQVGTGPYAFSTKGARLKLETQALVPGPIMSDGHMMFVIDLLSDDVVTKLRQTGKDAPNKASQEQAFSVWQQITQSSPQPARILGVIPPNAKSKSQLPKGRAIIEVREADKSVRHVAVNAELLQVFVKASELDELRVSKPTKISPGSLIAYKNGDPVAILQPLRVDAEQAAEWAAEIQAQPAPAQATEPKIVADARKRVRKGTTGEQANVGIQPLLDQALVTGYDIYKAGVTFAQWSRRMLSDLGQKVRPYLRQTWDKVRAAVAEFIQDEEGSFPASPGPPKRTGQPPTPRKPLTLDDLLADISDEAIRNTPPRNRQNRKPLTFEEAIKSAPLGNVPVKQKPPFRVGGISLRSPLSNLNVVGTYEAVAGPLGKQISDAFRSAHTELAYQTRERVAVMKDLRQTLKPLLKQAKADGFDGIPDMVHRHLSSIQNPDQTLARTAKVLTSFQYNTKLRWNPRSILLNWLQPFQTLWPHFKTGEFIDMMIEAHKPETRQRFAEIALRESGGKVEGMDEAKREQFWRNPFAWTSETNRIMGHLAGNRVADRLGLTGFEKQKMAAAWAEKVEFDNSMWNVPPLFRGNIARILGQFKPYAIKNIERLHADWKEGLPDTGSGKYARRAKIITGQLALGGVSSVLLPGVKSIAGVLILGSLAKALMAAGMPGDDADKMAEIAYFGLPALVAQDLSSSVTILDEPFGQTPQEQAVNFLGGPTASTLWKLTDAGKDFYTGAQAEEKPGQKRTPTERMQGAALKAAKTITPYVKTGQALYAASKGETPKMWLGKEEPMTKTEAVGFGLMGTPLRQSRYYEEKDAYDWQKKLLGRPVDIPGVKRKDGEPEEIYKIRAGRVQQWTDKYESEMEAYPRFQALPEPEKERARESLRKRISEEAAKKSPDLGRLDTPTILRSLQSSTKRRSKRNAKLLYVEEQ